MQGKADGQRRSGLRISVLLNVWLLIFLVMLVHQCVFVYTPYRRRHSAAIDRWALRLLNESEKRPERASLRLANESARRPPPTPPLPPPIPKPAARLIILHDRNHSEVQLATSALMRTAAPVPQGASDVADRVPAVRVASSSEATLNDTRAPLVAAGAVSSSAAPLDAPRPRSFATAAAKFNRISTFHENKAWWYDQIRHVDTLGLASDDVLFQPGVAVSELDLNAAPGSTPLDALLPGYVDMFEKIAAQRTPSINDKVVVVHPNAQMANRLRISVGALAMGLLFDKAISVTFSDGWFAALSDILTVAIDIQAPRLMSKSGRGVTLAGALCNDWSATRAENSGFTLSGNTYVMTLLSHNAKLQERWRQVWN